MTDEHPNGERDRTDISGKTSDREEFDAVETSIKQGDEPGQPLDAAPLETLIHDLRAPLTSILLQTRLLEREVPEEFGDSVCRIMKSGEQMAEILDSVLWMVESTDRGLHGRFEEVDVVQQVRACLEMLEPLAENEELDLVFEACEERLEERLEPILLKRIVINLVTNAIKFTDEGEVRVLLERSNDELLVVVEDTGRGIDSSIREQLSDDSFRRRDGAELWIPGAGLGLAICRRLVDILGGDIDVESEQGEGTTFSVRIPRVKASDSAGG